MTSTTERSRAATEAQLSALAHHIEHGLRGPALAEHLIAAAAQVLRLSELQLMAGEEHAGQHRNILRAAWADSRACRVTITDALMPMVREAHTRRLLAEEYVDLRSAA